MKTTAALLIAAMAAALSAAETKQVDLVSLDLGGRIESVTSQGSEAVNATRLIDGDPHSFWLATPRYPVEIVFSFFGRQTALFQSITIDPGRYRGEAHAKEIEVWTSNENASGPFKKLAAFTVARDGVQSFPVTATEARYVKLSVLSNYGLTTGVSIGKVDVIEGTRTGYQPLLWRNADLAVLVAGRVPDGWPTARSSPAPVPQATLTTSVCALPPATAGASQPPRHAESSNVLVITPSAPMYFPLDYARRNDVKATENASSHATFREVRPVDVRPALLGAGERIDTVVLAQVCNVQTSVSPAFRQVLAAWVAAGHKLIIHDSDSCGGKGAAPPDYSFLPYRFASQNPGALGAQGDAVALVEDSTLANANPSHPAFVDLESWKKARNELGDSNTIGQWDPHWCGVLVGTNALHVNGFEEAYAHHGRGLIIYNGFDKDQVRLGPYRQLVLRELLVPFDPDPLNCSVRLSDFVITTGPSLNTQRMVPGRSYTYPLTLIANQRYTGRVKLSLNAVPGDPAVKGTFQPDTVDLTSKAASTLTVTTTVAAGRGAHVLSVRGVDAVGQAATLCLNLVEPKTGLLNVTAPLPRKTSRNLEIILDESGSMKTPLGKSTRIDTARETLETVLAKVPDDFKVGLRLYGHRFASKQKQTCTDSELVLAVQKLDRARLLSIVARTKPRGETPLVYSVTQAINDLKAAGGGSVVLITDGEESCHGDPVTAATALRNSGLDLTLNIVGFTLKARQSQEQLSTLASGTGGRFYSAQNGDALGHALLAAAIRQFPYQVLDAGGKVVASGEAGGQAVELPPGLYRVVVAAADEEVIANGVSIAAGSDTTLAVAVKDGHFVISRQ